MMREKLEALADEMQMKENNFKDIVAKAITGVWRRKIRAILATAPGTKSAEPVKPCPDHRAHCDHFYGRGENPTPEKPEPSGEPVAWVWDTDPGTPYQERHVSIEEPLPTRAVWATKPAPLYLHAAPSPSRGVGMPLLHGKALLDYKLPLFEMDEDARRKVFVSGWLEAVGQSFKDRQDAIDSAHRAFRKYAEGVNASPPRPPVEQVVFPRNDDDALPPPGTPPQEPPCPHYCEPSHVVGEKCACPCHKSPAETPVCTCGYAQESHSLNCPAYKLLLAPADTHERWVCSECKRTDITKDEVMLDNGISLEGVLGHLVTGEGWPHWCGPVEKPDIKPATLSAVNEHLDLQGALYDFNLLPECIRTARDRDLLEYFVAGYMLHQSSEPPEKPPVELLAAARAMLAAVDVVDADGELDGRIDGTLIDNLRAATEQPEPSGEPGLEDAKRQLKQAIGAECERWAARQAMGVQQPTLVEHLYPIIDSFAVGLPPSPPSPSAADVPLPLSGKTARELATPEMIADDLIAPQAAERWRCEGCGEYIDAKDVEGIGTPVVYHICVEAVSDGHGGVDPEPYQCGPVSRVVDTIKEVPGEE
jgi:hypothetical protein